MTVAESRRLTAEEQTAVVLEISSQYGGRSLWQWVQELNRAGYCIVRLDPDSSHQPGGEVDG